MSDSEVVQDDRHLVVRSVGNGFYILPAGIIGVVLGVIGLLWFLIDIFLFGDNLILSPPPILPTTFAEVLPFYEYSWVGGICVTIFFASFVLFLLLVCTDLHGIEVFLISTIAAVLILCVIVIGLLAPTFTAAGLQIIADLTEMILNFLGAPHSLIFQLGISIVILIGVVLGFIQCWFKPYVFKPNAITYTDYMGKKRALSNLQNFEIHVGRSDFLERLLFHSGTVTLIIQERDDIVIRHVLRVVHKVDKIDELLRRVPGK